MSTASHRPETAATGGTAEMYTRIREHFGWDFVPDVFQLLSARPSFLRVLFDGYLSMFDEGVLPREVKELIATVVASENSCEYCVGAHTLFLELVGASSEVVEAVWAAGLFNAIVRVVDALGLHRLGQLVPDDRPAPRR